ncbi:MAG: nitroreductase family protein [Ilumatobacteraceae bacterium]
MDFVDLVRSRRMTRAFSRTPVERAVIEECLSLAARSPSAGKTQGWNVVGVLGDDTSLYWDAALPVARRDGFAFPGLLDAPFVGVLTADPRAYVRRYSEADKAHTGLGEGEDAWGTPYWTVDASMAAMTFLLALHDRGLGALFFAVAREADVRDALGVDPAVQVIGAVAAGVPAGGVARPGRSAGRPGRRGDEVIRWASRR